MRKIAFALTLLPLAAVPTHAAPAIVEIGGGECCMADGDGTFFCTTSPAVHVKVATNAGTLITTCHVDNVANSTGRAVTYNGGNTGGAQCCLHDPLLGGTCVFTNRWQEVVSSGGSNSIGTAELSCSYNAPSGQ